LPKLCTTTSSLSVISSFYARRRSLRRAATRR
jgi:hypothetical protein